MLPLLPNPFDIPAPAPPPSNNATESSAVGVHRVRTTSLTTRTHTSGILDQKGGNRTALHITGTELDLLHQFVYEAPEKTSETTDSSQDPFPFRSLPSQSACSTSVSSSTDQLEVPSSRGYARSKAIRAAEDALLNHIAVFSRDSSTLRSGAGQPFLRANPSRSVGERVKAMLVTKDYKAESSIPSFVSELLTECGDGRLDLVFSALKSLIRQGQSEHCSAKQGALLCRAFYYAGYAYEVHMALRKILTDMRIETAQSFNLNSDRSKCTAEQNQTIDIALGSAVEGALHKSDSLLVKAILRVKEYEFANERGYSPDPMEQTSEQKESICQIMQEVSQDIAALRSSLPPNLGDSELYALIYRDILGSQADPKMALFGALFADTSQQDLGRIAKVCQFFRDVVEANDWGGQEARAIKERNGIAMMIYPVLFNQEQLEKEMNVLRNVGDQKNTKERVDAIKTSMALAFEFLAFRWRHVETARFEVIRQREDALLQYIANTSYHPDRLSPRPSSSTPGEAKTAIENVLRNNSGQVSVDEIVQRLEIECGGDRLKEAVKALTAMMKNGQTQHCRGKEEIVANLFLNSGYAYQDRIALTHALERTEPEDIQSSLNDYTSLLWQCLHRVVERDVIIEQNFSPESTQRSKEQKRQLQDGIQAVLRDEQRRESYLIPANASAGIYSDIALRKEEIETSLTQIFLRRSPDDLERIEKLFQIFSCAVEANDWKGITLEATKQRHALAMTLYPVLFDESSLESKLGIIKGRPLTDEECAIMQRRRNAIKSALALGMEFLATNWTPILSALKSLRRQG